MNITQESNPPFYPKNNNYVVFRVDRHKYTDDTTLGKWYFTKKPFCYTLEDTLRPEGIKVWGHTGLPEGLYRLSTRYSPGFKRKLAVIYTEDDGITSKMGGIEFKYCLVHAGATHKNTAGCILVSDTYDGKERITPTRSCEQEIVRRVEALESQGKEVWLHITNGPQKK